MLFTSSNIASQCPSVPFLCGLLGHTTSVPSIKIILSISSDSSIGNVSILGISISSYIGNVSILGTFNPSSDGNTSILGMSICVVLIVLV
ncbi:hypothetical protein BGI42_15790 [Clostridium taeniosporum]|uniref:Uncharacterized protein n=1 Tax=Clostridium taeniosporum TaxID=394958 RepID=A0A2I6SDE9_9CLOT|nr:hypothetical protein BGI42_15790 [Clostridium taeniosporum]